MATAWIRDHLFIGTRRIWIAAAAVCLLTWQIGFVVPGTGVDLSWMAGLYMAIHAGKDFGKEIVFTYGPLGFLAWPGVWYSWLGLLAFLFSVAIFYAFAVALLAALERSVGLLAAVIVAFLFFATVPDLEQIPLMLAVGICFFALRENRPSWGLALLAVGGGTLSAFELLIKLSGGPEIFAACLLGMIGARAGRRHWALFLGSSIGGTLVLWLIAGQSIGSFWDYGVNGLQVVSGYNEAMGLGGARHWTGVVLILAALGLVVATALAPFRDGRARLFAVLLVAVASFASYKYGIVRFEPYHVALGLSALVGIWLQLPLPRARAVAFLAGTFVIGAIVVHTYPTVARLDVLDNLTAFRGAAEIAIRPGLREEKEDQARAALVAAYALEPQTLAAVKGKPVQIDPWEVSLAWAYELDWHPFPIFQNYVAYDQKLDELNAEAAEDPDGTQVILRENPGGQLPWGARSQENRLPAWDPPAQNLATACNFVPIQTTPVWQVLERVPDRCGKPEEISALTAQSDQVVQVPQAGRNEIVVMKLSGVEIEGFEKLKSLLWKAPLRAATLDEGLVNYRILPGTSGDGMVVSAAPRIAGHGAFEQLPRLKTIQIEGVDRQIGFTFYRVKVKPRARPTG